MSNVENRLFPLLFSIHQEPEILKFKAINIVPILLALLLPALRFYTNSEVPASEYDMFIYGQVYTSLFLMVLWYFLWQLWDIQRGNKRWYALVLLVLTLLLLLIYHKVFDTDTDFQVIGLLFPSALMLVIQYALKSQQKASHLFLEKEQLQTENYKTQLQALQSQVDPHFLFNSLNTLRSMVRQNHANSEKFIMSLSDFFRQTLKYKEDTTLKLSNELELLEAYLFLMKSRNEQAIVIDISIDKKLYQLELPTLALQVVVENCFKHNSMTAKKPLFIEIGNVDQDYVIVRNNRQPILSDEVPSGHGLELLEKRYDLMNIKNGVKINENEHHFSVHLKLLKR
ncbi:MAG: histidine kinase [Bacteroidota bacterium]